MFEDRDRTPARTDRARSSSRRRPVRGRVGVAWLIAGACVALASLGIVLLSHPPSPEASGGARQSYPSGTVAADREFEEGKAAQRADRFDEARRHYDHALHIIPDHGPSATAVKDFLREARRAYECDRMAYLSGRISRAAITARFERVLPFLRPTDRGVYNVYTEALTRLQATGKF